MSKQVTETTTPKMEKGKKYARYPEARAIYGVGQSKMEKMIVDAGAKIKWGRLVYIDLEKMEEHMERCRMAAKNRIALK